MTSESAKVPPLLLAATVASVGMVTVVCAVVNYVHIRDLATAAGMGSLAGWLPLGVDGLVVASTCSVMVDRHLGRPVESLAVIGVALGLAGSLIGNVLAVDPGLVSLRGVRWVLAGYSPAAVAVAVHLLFRMFGGQRTAVQLGTARTPASEVHQPDRVEAPAVRTNGGPDISDLIAPARPLVDQLRQEHKQVSGRALRTRLRDQQVPISNAKASALARHFEDHQ